MMKPEHTLLILITCLFVSCNTPKKIVYIQDAADGESKAMEIHQGIIIQPKDLLSIIISSKNPELAVAFNLPLVAYHAGSEMTTTGDLQKTLGYLVDLEGNIDFPILGKIKVAGLTRLQLSEMIKHLLIIEDLLKDPVVTTEFLNFKISILGEVQNPGTYNVPGDRITILEAVGMAGDLTIYGKRENIVVVRENGNERISYRVDIRSVQLFNSPVFYLKQNDVVYVEPNNTRAGQSRINDNKSLSMWVSIASLLTSMMVLILN